VVRKVEPASAALDATETGSEALIAKYASIAKAAVPQERFIPRRIPRAKARYR